MELGQTQNLDEAIVEMSLVSQQLPLDEDLKLALNALLQLKKKDRLDARILRTKPDADKPHRHSRVGQYDTSPVSN
jgi:hypothetical protein